MSSRGATKASIRLTAHPDYPDVLLSDVAIAPGASLLSLADALLDIAVELERRGIPDGP